MSEVVKTLYFSQDEILRSIIKLHAKGGFDCDLTYGNGSFWRNVPEPRICYDIEPLADHVRRGCSTQIQHEDATLGHTVFDPPFLTYVRNNREGNGSMIMSGRFSGYWRYDELEAHYKGTLEECARVIKPGATLTFKCQDIVHNHSLHATHASVIEWAKAVGFRLKDLFILGATHRLPSPNRRGEQKHSRVFHSYFLVFERLTEAQQKRREAA